MEKNSGQILSSSFFALLLLFAIFITSSFDYLFVFKYKGFTIRISQLFVLLFMILVFIDIIKIKKFVIPLGFNFLIIWALFILIFIPNTTIILRNIGYAFWLLFSIAMIFFLTNYLSIFSSSNKDINLVLKLYVLSFTLISIFLVVEFIFFYLKIFKLNFLRVWWRGNIPRVSLLSYEPSYFATYLIPGLVLSSLLWIHNYKLFRKNNELLMIFIIVSQILALFLCNGRSGYIVFALFIVYLFFSQLIELIINRRINVKILCYIGIFLIGGILVLIIYQKQYGENALKEIFAQTGLFSTSNTSFSIRWNTAMLTLKIFLKHPLKGVSLGGIPSSLAMIEGKVITTQFEAKHYEGSVVLFEILAASGIVGFIFFVLYFLKLIIRPLMEKNIVLYAGAISLLFALIILQFNQNILRIYFWLHIAVLSSFYEVYGSKKEKFFRLTM